MADYHHALSVKARQTAHDGMVVAVMAVAVQFLEIGTQRGNIIQCVRPLRMAGNLRNLCGCELVENGFGQIHAFFLQTGNLIGNIDRRIVMHQAQLFDFIVQFRNGLFKIQKNRFHKNLATVRIGGL